MIPGQTSKCTESTVASAATIDAKTDIILVTGNTQINTINPFFGGGFSGIVTLIPTDGAVVLGNSGNILVGITMAQNRAVSMVYSRSKGKWYIDNGV